MNFMSINNSIADNLFQCSYKFLKKHEKPGHIVNDTLSREEKKNVKLANMEISIGPATTHRSLLREHAIKQKIISMSQYSTAHFAEYI